MTRQWIAASKALFLVAGAGGSNGPARLALCTRAHNGLVATKAVLLVVGGKRHEDKLIPPGFWWAGGHEALEQNWETGDFGTWQDNQVEWRAFGVVFDLDGVLAMVPAGRRARLARDLSVASDPAWASSREAWQIARIVGGLDPETAGRVLINQCELGFIAARAVSVRRTGGNAPPEEREHREWDIPVWFWSSFARPRYSFQGWEQGKFEGSGDSPNGKCQITLTGVYFLHESLAAAFPPPIPPVEHHGAPAARPVRAGGRPPADYWDDLWCAVWGSIYRGDLKPKTQADVERAMLQWASDHDHEPVASTIRPRARKLMKALEDEGENSGET
jgi:hypothetical protein